MEKESKDKKINDIRIMILGLIFYLIITVIVTLIFDKVPILFNISLYGKDSFWEDLIVSMHSSLIDFLFLGIIIYHFTNKLEEKRKVQSYHDNIDDVRFWFEKEATSKLIANIKRLNEKGYNRINLTRCFLKGAYLKDVNLIDSPVMGANFEETNLRNSILDGSDFKGVSFKRAKCEGARIINGRLRNIKCYESDFQGVDFTGCDFMNSELVNSNFKNAFFKNANLKGVKYDNSNFERANFLGAKNIDIESILKCKTLKYAKLDRTVELEIESIKPDLFK
ncbi:pentapeptide repeat-containing protein [Clostridium sp. MSJ-11]|uniref:Pentapeptide repeat-containing protein n=1 Tax=Clostridium mobile TaxID=2841512 RepID=A0ABS6EGJ3_9CLOT|nr:pentapeptide repeat-containing protein [Clostridium mobile]MBU5484272.1 pentapeptide repeat-containing protein [Clostridium mobile]